MKQPIDPSIYADQALAPAIQFAARNRGTVAEVARKMSKRLGRPVHRQQVEAWLHEDKAKRREPGLGTGLLLIGIVSGLKGKK